MNTKQETTKKVERTKINISKEIEVLKEAGHKVRVTHSRYYKFVKPETGGEDTEIVELVECSTLRRMKAQGIYDPKNLCTTGGKTQVDITFVDGLVTKGESFCHEKDNFNKKTGILKAYFRAMAPRLKEIKKDFRETKKISQ